MTKKIIPTKDSRQMQTVHKYFEGMEVIEATANLYIQPLQEDIDSGVPEDPRNCLFSRACQRMYNSRTVLFYGTIAYVDLMCEDGIRRVHRFQIGFQAQRYLRTFDDRRELSLKGFYLRAPTPSEVLSVVRKRSAEQHARNKQKRKALMKGETIVKNGTPKKRPAPKVGRLSILRNGTGMAQFPPSKIKA